MKKEKKQKKNSELLDYRYNLTKRQIRKEIYSWFKKTFPVIEVEMIEVVVDASIIIPEDCVHKCKGKGKSKIKKGVARYLPYKGK